MMGNREKTMVISSTANEWPQNPIDEKGLMASTGMAMEKPRLDQQPLKCPRCDSSNTKFCYYNNYSLSQPRHFCKACKRYWTRGGTLRNVPVGGGCRKNKRIKRPASSSSDTAPSSLPPTPAPTHSPLQIDVAATSSHISPLFYGLPTNPSDINLPFPRFNSRASNMETVVQTSCNGYDLQPQINALGLGFSSPKITSDGHDAEYQTRFNPNTQIQDAITSNSFLSNYSLFGSSSSSNSPTLASLIASNLEQPKTIFGGLKGAQAPNHFQAFLPFQDLQMEDVKMEDENNRMSSKLEWNVPCQNQIEAIGSSDQSLYWNATNVGSWPDLSNYGPSATPLI